MDVGGYSAAQWLVLVQHELLLFAGLMFLVGALDEWAVDLLWLRGRATGRIRTGCLPSGGKQHQSAERRFAIFVPAWQEANVIGATLRHMLRVWPQARVVFYVGCYPNDPATLAAAMEVAATDPRVRLAVCDTPGPTTKADCLNRLWRALRNDEAAGHPPVDAVVLHDAEDMVDPAALAVIDDALEQADFVQLPVLPLPQRGSRWIGSHYAEEFAEAHGKAMVVRDMLGAAMPAAGVGCAVAREWLDRLALRRGDGAPFAADSLTEDYEMGLALGAMGARARFVRVRDGEGRLVATRAAFPDTLEAAVRQKTRWVNGIALLGWDRTGWSRGGIERWMLLRDRRGPLTALVMLVAYALLFLLALTHAAYWWGWGVAFVLPDTLRWLLLVNAFALAWRAAFRFAFTAREYGVAEGLRAVLRIPLANIVAIMAGRRALFSYLRLLMGAKLRWDKTHHTVHPALLEPRDGPAPRQARGSL